MFLLAFGILEVAANGVVTYRSYLQRYRGSDTRLFSLALFVCGLADIALALDDVIPVFFLIGLAVFLFAHLLNIYALSTISTRKSPPSAAIKHQPNAHDAVPASDSKNAEGKSSQNNAISVPLRADLAVVFALFACTTAYVFVNAEKFKKDLAIPVILYCMALSSALWRACARLGLPGEIRSRHWIMIAGAMSVM